MSKHTRHILAFLVAALSILLFGSSRTAHADGPILRIEPSRAAGGTRVPVAASLTDGAGQPVAGARIIFYVDGERDGEARTDDNGRAAWRIRRALSADSHQVEAAWADRASSLRAVTQLVVAPARLELQLPQAARVGEPLSLAARLMTPGGKAVNDAVVTFLVNGQREGTARTNADGRVEWRVRSSLAAGTYPMAVVYDGAPPCSPLTPAARWWWRLPCSMSPRCLLCRV